MALAKGSQVALLGVGVCGRVLGGSAATTWTVYANGVVLSFLDADLAPDETVGDTPPAGFPAVGEFIFFFDARYQVTAYVHRAGAAGQKIQVLTRWNEVAPAFPYVIFVNVP
jgi:hypothetical protein